jgi:hypothetical protein
VGASLIVPFEKKVTKVEADPWTSGLIPLPASTFEIKEVGDNKFKVV